MAKKNMFKWLRRDKKQADVATDETIATEVNPVTAELSQNVTLNPESQKAFAEAPNNTNIPATDDKDKKTQSDLRQSEIAATVVDEVIVTTEQPKAESDKKDRLAWFKRNKKKIDEPQLDGTDVVAEGEAELLAAPTAVAQSEESVQADNLLAADIGKVDENHSNDAQIAESEKKNMLSWFKRDQKKSDEPQSDDELIQLLVGETEQLDTKASESAEPENVVESEESKSSRFFKRLKNGLKRTGSNIGGGIVSLFRGKKIDDELFEELETQLLMADVGVETTTRIIDSLTKRASIGDLKDGEALLEHLKTELAETLTKVEQPLAIECENGPLVILMVGVNGVGKTTTIGKLAKQFQAEGKSVMLAAGDTFRAAAVEQLQVWGERNQIPVVAQHTGADSASVIFDAVQSAKARNIDILIADTAGRLQNKAHLMDELKKIVRVMKKIDPAAPHEIMLTLDASTGQNALSQTQLFDEAVGLTGLTLTKLDGTAKGGVIFALADKFSIPIRYIGIGEGLDDLRPFASKDFIDALFSDTSKD